MEVILLVALVVLLIMMRFFHNTSKRQGHNKRRRLHQITDALSATPSSTVVFRLPLIGRQHIITADPGNVQHVLKTNFQNYPKGDTFRSTLHDLFGDCIVNADGHTWRKQRVFAAREFTVAFLHYYGDSVLDSEISERLLPFLTKIAGGSHVVDFQDVLLRFAFDNICRAAFTHDPECLSGSGLPSSEFAESFDNAVLLLSSRLKDMLPTKVLWMKKALNIGCERELKKAVSAVRRITMGIVREKQRKHEQLGEDARNDFLSRLTKLSNNDTTSGNGSGSGIEDNEVTMKEEFRASMVAGVILAGRDTTSAVLTWFFWLLSRNSLVEAQILDEIKRGENNNKTAYEAAREMPYTHAALCEAMRLYPPIPVVVKEAQNRDVLPDETEVARGDRIVIVTYAMGRIEKVWGPDWSQFRPERWLDPEGRFVGKDPYTFPVFNAGPRICLGKEMAFVQMKRVVASVLPRFKILPVTPVEFMPEYVFDLTAKMKGGFPVKLQDRLLS